MVHQDVLSASVNDIRLLLERKGGKWTCEITGVPLPRDVSYAQKLLSDTYRGQRRKIAQNFKQSKQKYKQLRVDAERAKKDLERAEEAQGVNDVGTNEIKRGSGEQSSDLTTARRIAEAAREHVGETSKV